MVSSSLSSSSSGESHLSSPSQTSLGYAPPSPSSSNGRSSSSSSISLHQADDENVTITASRPLSNVLGKQKSQEDLRLLAVSTHMTELSYAISDIQTRIFEIQELRHKSQSLNDTTGTTSIIDQSLMSLNERLESAEKGVKSVTEALDPLLQVAATPTLAKSGDPNDNAVMLRKHATLVAEWEAVQNESDVLREELKEDKWLTVFRTVTDQADGMMSSLEKAVNRCQEFIWQVHRRGVDESFQLHASLSSSQQPPPVTYNVFVSLLESFEAKKKHYMPATSKVLSIMDKGVRDRVTKNGETLRRHAESAQRWRNLRERIARTDAEMESVRRILTSADATPSENGSSTSGTSKNGYLVTPPSGYRASRAPSSSGSASESASPFSPFRKIARKFAGTRAPPVTPLTVNKRDLSRVPSSDPVPSSHTIRRQRSSLLPSMGDSQLTGPMTPHRPGHKHSQSLTPESSPRAQRLDINSTIKGLPGTNKQRWNSSTKVGREERALTIKGTPPRRPPSSFGMYTNQTDIPPVPPLGTPYRRSLSRASMASSRPWSPVTSSISTTPSSHHNPFSTFRPPSRAQTPSGALTPGPSMTPRPRPKTPSHIPMPSIQLFASPTRSERGDGTDNRSFSPALSVTSAGFGHPPRPPSRSMIPIPSLHLSSPSRPSTSMSDYTHAYTPPSFRTSAIRAQTPEHTIRSRVQQMPIFHGSLGRASARPQGRAPPSSFRDSSSSRTPSRPGSRTGAHTPNGDTLPMHEYVPANSKDPLDLEVAEVVNSTAHGLLVERVDPPLRKIPRDGEEIKAQYAFSNALGRKVVTCRLTTLTRSGRTAGDVTTKKVMCRVGGGWQDLSHYILNRQAGL